MRRHLLVLPLVAALVACGGDDDDTAGTAGTVPPVSTTDGTAEPPATPAAPATDPETTPPPSFVATPITAVPSTPTSTRPGFPVAHDMRQVTAAVADLAGRLDLDPADVTVVDARAVTWGDSSMGCPEPGMRYLQVIEDGMLVVLKAGGKVYEYHGGDPLFLCEHPRAPSGG